MRRSLLITLTIVLLAWASAVSASTLFVADLVGSQEVPPNASTASGLGSVLLNDAQDSITVNLSWSDLTAPATAAHIHGPAAPGVSAPVLFGFSGVPNATSGAIPQQVFAITPAQVAQLQSGLYYMNVHDSVFPGGEIRGQLYQAVPDASTLSLGAIGLGSLAGLIRRRRR